MSILHQCTVSPTLVSRDSHRPLPFWPCGTKDLSPQICYPSTPTNLKSQSRFVPLKFNIAFKKSNFRRQSSKKMRKGGPQMFPTEFPTQNLQPKKKRRNARSSAPRCLCNLWLPFPHCPFRFCLRPFHLLPWALHGPMT